MKKSIKISIPDNLTEEQEVIAIAKKLKQKTLSGGGRNKDVKRIGTELNISQLETTITITRTSTEKPIEMVPCNVCGVEYQNNTAKFYFHNYGGNRKKRAVCSDECLNSVLSFRGGRAAKSASKLKHPINFFTR